jgi:hypothetical protein
MRCQMKAAVCPLCDVVSDVPHQTQQGCIDALQKEIARIRQVLERRRDAPIVGAVRSDLGRAPLCPPSDSNVVYGYRLSLRCTLET